VARVAGGARQGAGVEGPGQPRGSRARVDAHFGPQLGDDVVPIQWGDGQFSATLNHIR
jgi:hypothetical protein